MQVLREEVGDLRDALEARKLIERAKGILMRDLAVSEQDAYRWLKATSSRTNCKMSEIARRVVALESA
ncbi:MAG: ANTAR domain-containing protein, partial [Gemmatimonadales bacterium]|nr:ANTAR domain-containing protein [Gemmatimonadales bacterium]